MRTSLSVPAGEVPTDTGGVLAETLNRRIQRRRTPSRASGFYNQAVWYIGAFMITYIFSHIALIMDNKGGSGSFVVLFIAKTLQPLQGLLNIFVYTRPYVKKLRQGDITKTYLQAFIAVVLSGGDDDRDQAQRRGAPPNQRRGQQSNNNGNRDPNGLRPGANNPRESTGSNRRRASTKSVDRMASRLTDYRASIQGKNEARGAVRDIVPSSTSHMSVSTILSNQENTSQLSPMLSDHETLEQETISQSSINNHRLEIKEVEKEKSMCVTTQNEVLLIDKAKDIEREMANSEPSNDIENSLDEDVSS